jgi:RNA polymerase sigma-70 factor (ECF subfamily)
VDEDEFMALYDEVKVRLFSFAAKRLSGHAAEDIVSQTFITVWEKRAECPEDPNSKIGWVFTIGRYKILQEVDRRRRKHHDNRFIHDFQNAGRSDGDIADVVSDRAIGSWVYSQLSALDRDLFDVAFMRDATKEQAAACLQISVGTFNTRVSRLRAKMRLLLDAAMETDSVREMP